MSKVEKIKEQIKNGTYVADIETTAEKIILLETLNMW